MEILGRELKIRSWLIPLLSAFWLSQPSAAAAQTLEEYEVKAAFLFNFTKFVEWPSQQGDAASAFVIGILGDDPFGSTIDRLVKGKTVQGRTIEVRRLKQPSEARLVHIVFVRSVEKDKAAKLIDAVQGASVLTVGEGQDFLRMGGIVYLGIGEKSVGVVINFEAAERAKLKISAKLLSLATIYKDTRAVEK